MKKPETIAWPNSSQPDSLQPHVPVACQAGRQVARQALTYRAAFLMAFLLIAAACLTPWARHVAAADAAADVPADTSPAADTASGGASPAEATPAEPAPAEPAPANEQPAESTPAEAQPADSADGADAAKAEPLGWIAGLAEGRRRAAADGKPMLVRATADWCPPCRVMREEVAKDELREVLAQWTLVEVDVDRWPDDARQLNIAAIPTLAILDLGGQPVAIHQGVIRADALATWLREHREAAQTAPDNVFAAEGAPTAAVVIKLVAGFGSRDPAVRQAAMGRLRPHPALAGSPVFEKLKDGALAEQLTALELLDAWNAPVDDIDPWRPETINTEHLARLEVWLHESSSSAAAAKRAAEPEPLSAEDRAAAGLEIDRMLRGTDAEAAPACDRLARFGLALAEEVDRRLAAATTDADRARLRALRYRLVASDTLAVRWPGGLERLTNADSAVRQQAAEQLASLATPADQPLLLRLFADADPLVREIGLRGVQRMGGRESLAAMGELLADPEPNVRAAVLKLLEETPNPAMTPRVAEYLKTETDPDLIVHALRFLRAARGPVALRAMMGFASHPSWQVRAEAAAGLGNVETSFRNYSFGGAYRGTVDDKAAESQAEVYAVLIQMLSDSDSFVVSRAVEGLQRADLAIAVEPLAGAAGKHPELAASIIAVLARGAKMRPKAAPHLRRFLASGDPGVRAAAITGLAQAAPSGVSKELKAAIFDSDSSVRTAAAKALSNLFNKSKDDAVRVIERQQKNTQKNMRRLPGDPFGATPSLMNRLGAAVGQMFTIAPPPATVFPTPSTIVSQPAQSGGALAPVLSGVPDHVTPIPPPATEPAAEDGATSSTPLLEDTEMGNETEDGAEAEGNEESEDEQSPDGAEDAVEVGEPLSPAELLDPGPRWDRWLAGFSQGKGRPAFAGEMIEPLRAMLKAEDVHERHAAALALVPLGLAEEALPVLLEAVRDEPGLLEDSANVLPWLPWPQRQATFERLHGMAEPDEMWSLLRCLLPLPDRRATDLLWSLLEHSDEAGRIAMVVEDELATIYLGLGRYDSSYEIPAAIQKETLLAVRPLAAAESMWPRLVALKIILRIAPAEVAELAESLAGDETADPMLRRAAFQIYLASQLEPRRQEAAMAILQQKAPFHVKIALTYLAEGKDALQHLQVGESDARIALSFADGARVYSRPEGFIVPEAPPGLTPEMVKPWLDHEDPAIASRAGYLLAVLGDAAGLPPLLKAWRLGSESGQDVSIGRDDSLDRLVFRAIAILNDASHIEVLRTIRGAMYEYEVREFYWTIRIMSGPEILQFRKEIRDEVGMDNLR